MPLQLQATDEQHTSAESIPATPRDLEANRAAPAPNGDAQTAAAESKHALSNSHRKPSLPLNNADVSSLDVASMLHSAEEVRSSLLHPEDDPSHYRSLILTKTLVGGVGFLSDAYMLFGLALLMVLTDVTHPQADGDKALMTNAVIVGSIVGQIAFGIVADYVGRRKAFIATLSMLIAGALMCAGSFSARSFRLYHAMALSLFVLGIGIGGEYPLSATVSSEWATRDPWNRGRRIASVFSLQSIGAVLAPAVVCILLSASSLSIDAVWRIALAIGAVPGAIMLHFRCTMKETESYIKSHGHDVHRKDANAHKLRDLKAFSRQLIGCAGSWFIFDVVFYANGFFSSTLLLQRYKPADRSNPLAVHSQLLSIAEATLYLQLLSLPGYWLAAWLIDVVGRRALQIGSFAAMAVTYAVCGLSMEAMLAHPALFYCLYGLTFTASQGANIVTYVLPSELFPTTIRASAHGLSAAVGKAGAAVGGAIMPVLLRRLGLGSVMFVSATLSLLGLLWSLANTWETLGRPLPSSARYHRQHTKEGVPLVMLELRMFNPRLFEDQPLSAFVGSASASARASDSSGSSGSRSGLALPKLSRAVSAPLPTTHKPAADIEARPSQNDINSRDRDQA